MIRITPCSWVSNKSHYQNNISNCIPPTPPPIQSPYHYSLSLLSKCLPRHKRIMGLHGRVTGLNHGKGLPTWRSMADYRSTDKEHHDTPEREREGERLTLVCACTRTRKALAYMVCQGLSVQGVWNSSTAAGFRTVLAGSSE